MAGDDGENEIVVVAVDKTKVTVVNTKGGNNDVDVNDDVNDDGEKKKKKKKKNKSE
jgi:hypothetical protein